MGLDMYLSKKTYITRFNDDVEISIKKNGKDLKGVDTERINQIVEQIAYWRKFNALHKWFVDNCQSGQDDCGEYSVSEEQIREILEILKQINSAYLESEKKGIKKAEKLLPAQDGFFFGSSHYDDWYFEKVAESINIFEAILLDITPMSDFYYQASW